MTTTADDLFLRQVNDAISTTGAGSELAARIAALHHDAVLAEIDVMEKDVSAARDQAAQTAAAASLQWHHNGPLLEMLQHLTRRRSEASARASHMGGLLNQVAKLCAAAETGGATVVPVHLLKSLISRTTPAAEWTPAMLSFVPSQQYRLGYFNTEDEAVVRAFPFVGYALYEENPEQVPKPHTAFLVDGAVKARPQIQQENGLVLKHLE